MDSFSKEILDVWWSMDHPNLVDTHHHSSISLPDYDMFSARSGTVCNLIEREKEREGERERERGGGGESENVYNIMVLSL
jgi:hypothetical protein